MSESVSDAIVNNDKDVWILKSTHVTPYTKIGEDDEFVYVCQCVYKIRKSDIIYDEEKAHYMNYKRKLQENNPIPTKRTPKRVSALEKLREDSPELFI